MYDVFIRAAFWNLTETGQRLTDEELGYSFYGNRLVGVPRLRQLRVLEDTCVLHPGLQLKGIPCFGHFSVETESDEAYGKVPGYNIL